MNRLAIPASIILDASKFASTEETRYYLNGVYVHLLQGVGPVAVATDGPRLVVVRAESAIVATERGVIIATTGRKEFLSALKANKRDSADRWVIVDTEDFTTGVAHVVLASDATEALCVSQDSDSYLGRFNGALIDGTFPDYGRVIPEAVELIPVNGFRSDHVAVFGSLSENKAGGVTLFSTGNGAPMIVRVDTRSDVLGVVMPYRVDTKDAFPEWWVRRHQLVAAE